MEPESRQAPAASSPFDSCTILWSTQSGRAKACARRTARLVRSRGISVLGGLRTAERRGETSGMDERYGDACYGCTFDDYGATNFLALGRNEDGMQSKSILLILFVSTTGDAEQCDSIRNTWAALLQKSLPPDQLKDVQFALFALGDRAYGPAAFCAAGRKLAARLVQLGAKPFCAVGYGDDGTPNGGVYADLDVWLERDLLPMLTPPGCTVDNEMEMSESPYEIRKAGETIRNDETSSSREWLMDPYRDDYKDFFASSCPATSYCYDENTGLRIVGKDALTCRAIPPLLGHVTANERLTAEDWTQNTRHIRIHVETTKSTPSSNGKRNDSMSLPNFRRLPYQAGDVATILPSNTPASVSKFLSVLPRPVESIADESLQITTHSSSCVQWPQHCTLRGLLTHCADINSLPEREDLRSLSKFCNLDHPEGKDHRDKLISLSETSDAALFGDYVIREKRGWADVLYDFDSIRYESGESRPALTIEHLLLLLPPIMPRHFSIASAPSTYVIDQAKPKVYDSGLGAVKNSGFEIDLCVAVVEGKTPHGRPFTGLCSSYLSGLGRVLSSIHEQNSDNTIRSKDFIEHSEELPFLRLWVRPGSFGELPLKPLTGMSLSHRQFFETPILCIGSGTGIAPLRSLLHEREAVRCLASPDDCLAGRRSGDVEENVLIFGCRKKTMDFYYQSEWESMVKQKHLRLLTAFSQDQWHKIYVQQVARDADNGLLISRHVLELGGAIYIAGGAKMARAVKDEISECLAKAMNGGERDAKILLKRLTKAGKFRVEAWS